MVPRGQWRAAKVSAAHGKPAKAKREAMLAFWIAALGDGDPTVLRLVRRHGNYAENAAIFVASLALLEMMGAVRPFVIGLAALFIAG